MEKTIPDLESECFGCGKPIPEMESFCNEECFNKAMEKPETNEAPSYEQLYEFAKNVLLHRNASILGGACISNENMNAIVSHFEKSTI